MTWVLASDLQRHRERPNGPRAFDEVARISPLDFRVSAFCGPPSRPAYSHRLRDVELAHSTLRCPPMHYSFPYRDNIPLHFYFYLFTLPGEFSLQYCGELPQVPHPRSVHGYSLGCYAYVTRESCLASYNLLTISLLAYTRSFSSTIARTEDRVCAPSRNIGIPVIVPPRQGKLMPEIRVKVSSRLARSKLI